MQVTEELDYRKPVPQGRRDLRPGKQTARCRLLPKGLYVEMSWEEPLAGQLTETYLIEQDTLYVESSIRVEDGSASTVVVSLLNSSSLAFQHLWHYLITGTWCQGCNHLWQRFQFCLILTLARYRSIVALTGAGGPDSGSQDEGWTMQIAGA